MTEIVLYNTMARAKQAFIPADPRRVTLYVCGPTVYNYAHIGNARPVVAFDVLFRLLRARYGAEHIVHARNFTDIDDKIIARARETGEPIQELTRRFADIYRADMVALGNLPPDFEPRATDHVGGMLTLIEGLVAKGHAYATPSGVWFSVASMPDYGKLSGRTLADLRHGARVEAMEDKNDPADFALWKAAKPGEPFWDSPWGPGRPGWHIECSAMIEAILGRTIDLHAGGHDLIFPHHENEIAQSECAHDAPLARFWLHNGFLTMDSEKMSKSQGNVALIHDLLADWPGEVLRFALLSGHYRAPLDFTTGLLEQAKATLDRLYGALERADAAAGAAPGTGDFAPSPEIWAALADDLNSPEALAGLSGLAASLNKARIPAEITEIAGQLRASGEMMGLLGADPAHWFRAKAGDGDSDAIEALVAARTAARAARNWAEADRLRDQLNAAGVEVLDGAGGSSWRRR